MGVLGRNFIVVDKLFILKFIWKFEESRTVIALRTLA